MTNLKNPPLHVCLHEIRSAGAGAHYQDYSHLSLATATAEVFQFQLCCYLVKYQVLLLPGFQLWGLQQGS
jgi:hypothetical protein